jgi:hypothetical protein
MTRFPFLAVALLALPTVAGAEEVWRWRDARGLHYSNIPALVPADAEPVRTRLGHASTSIQAEDPVRVREDLERYRELRQQRVAEARQAESLRAVPIVAGYYDCCAPFGLQHLLTTTGRSLADQVQEASLLDALNVRWRRPMCP